ncbi:eukaryotic translation initiation factor 3 subunit 7 [Phaffia rhodozyma]|uniref:Eukaryotic translation initiation factor 3 subunit D n=1 Tax=Phaffia rhodozyma TaxID=264483 RepID=A0A0F7SMQ5_PHARH|nr:eukaryotic translation initiation factor 3 subunit 7 [Phaffia rhodozyma]
MSTDFVLPEIIDNADGSWGPSGSHLSTGFKDIPYAHYNKADRIERIVEWYDAPAGQASSSSARPSSAAYNARTRRDGASSGTTNDAFGYVHGEDEKSFSLVDNKSSAGLKPRNQGGLGIGRIGGGGNRGGRGGAQAGRGGAQAARGGAQQRNYTRGGGRGGFNNWNQNTRVRESSVAISPEWPVLEEIEFNRLSKLSLAVSEPETLASYGTVYAYEKSYDRITTKTSQPLQTIDRTKFNPTTSDDPIIQEFASKDTARVYTTDAILSVLMCAPRSVNSWDIVVNREGDNLYLDKREGGAFDFITVNENAIEPPLETSETDPSNAANSLSLEATFVNFNYACQVVSAAEAAKKKPSSKVDLGKANPFYNPKESTDPLASCGYRYRKFDISTPSDEEPISVVVRTEVDSVIKAEKGSSQPDQFVNVRTLLNGPSGTVVDWKQKLDSGRGAIAAQEMKNNSAKLARWAIQSILAGAEVIKMAYIARATPKDRTRHVVLGTQTYKPKDFAAQMNLSVANGWGIVRTIVDLCMKQPEGRYVLVKDPNKAIVRLYSVPDDAFKASAEGEDEEEFDGIDEE